MFTSSLRVDLPLSCSTSFSMDATGGYLGGVAVRIRAAMDQDPGSSLLLTGSSLHGAPNVQEPSNTARTATSVAPDTPTSCQPGTYGL